MATATMKRPTPKTVRMGQQKAQLSIGLEEVDAELATEWLSRNSSNRTVRKRKVIEFRRDMIAGKWLDVGDPIRFDTNNEMIDGQHRLMALVQAEEAQPGICLTFAVVRGVEPENRAVIDTGTKRTAGDQLKMAGYRNHALLAAATKWSVIYDRQVLDSADSNVRSVTHSEILDYVERNPALVSITETVANRMRSHIDMPPGYVACAYFLCSRVSDGEAFEFFERLTDGQMLTGGDPILALRSRLRDLDRNKANLAGEAWLSLVFRAWNAKREGRSMRVIPLDRAGRPIPAPNLV